MARVADHLSQSTCLEMLHSKTDEHPNPSVEVHHLVGKLSTAETLLTEVQRKVPTCPGSFLVINVCNQGNYLCSPCIQKCISCCIRFNVHSYFAVLKLCVALPHIKICLLPGFYGRDQGNREIQLNAYGPPPSPNRKPDIK